MSVGPKEQDQRLRFDEVYTASQSPVMLEIERDVCGCAFGATSWTTRTEADRMGELMRLQPGMRLLDVGAGAGWPALYLAQTSGCDVTLADTSEAGLRIAAQRAAAELLSGACEIAAVDGAQLPFQDNSFDAVSHSDALCCLEPKRAVLAECRRVVRRDGRMVFAVIAMAPNLNGAQRDSVLAGGPEYIVSETDYPTLLAQTGWALLERFDTSDAYAHTCRGMIKAFGEKAEALNAALGVAAYNERLAKLRLCLTTTENGWQVREMFAAAPI